MTVLIAMIRPTTSHKFTLTFSRVRLFFATEKVDNKGPEEFALAAETETHQKFAVVMEVWGSGGREV